MRTLLGFGMALALAVAWAVHVPSPDPITPSVSEGTPAARVVPASPIVGVDRALAEPVLRRSVDDFAVGRRAVTGTVVDGDDAPVVGATVRATLCAQDEVPLRGLGVATTDARGRYRIPLDAIASWSAIARAELLIRVEAAPRGFGWGDEERVELETDASGVPFAVADLWIGPEFPMHIVTGRVVDAAGSPVRGAEVRHREDGRCIATDTREDGTFRLEIDDEERSTTLWAFQAEVGTTGPVELALGEAPAVHEVVLRLVPRGGSLVGAVRFPDGTPARGVPIELNRCGPAFGSRGYRGPPEWECYAVVETDPMGRFRAVGLEPGNWRIDAPVDAFEAGDGTPSEESLEPVVHRTTGPPCEMVLASGRLFFEVVDDRGRPVPASVVRFVEWDAGTLAERTAAALAQGRAPDAETLEWGYSDECECDANGTARIWLEPGEVVAWQVGAPGAVSVEGWTRMPEVATDVRRRVVAGTRGPTTGVILRACERGGRVVHPAAVAAWRPWAPDHRARLPFEVRNTSSREHAVPRDGFVPLSPGRWRLELRFDPERCLLSRVVDVDVPASSPALVDVVAERCSGLAVRFVWVREQVGPDFSANYPCAHPFMTFAPEWRPEDGDDVDLELRDLSGERIASAPQPRSDPLETFAARGLAPGAGTLRVRMSVFDAVELDTTLREGLNRFEVRVDRRNRPFSIRRLSARR